MKGVDGVTQNELLERATRVFGNEPKACRWLRRPHTAFDDRSPLEVARRASGREEVYDLLGRIEHGVYG